MKSSTRLGAMVSRKIREEQARLTDSMVSGACADFAAYRFHAGQLDALRRALELVGEAETLYNGDEEE